MFPPIVYENDTARDLFMDYPDSTVHITYQGDRLRPSPNVIFLGYMRSYVPANVATASLSQTVNFRVDIGGFVIARAESIQDLQAKSERLLACH
jgi:hypothetical protein